MATKEELEFELMASQREAEYYRVKLMIFQDGYDRETELSKKILHAQSILTEMMFEVQLYGARNGFNEKYKQSMERIQTLIGLTDECSKIDDYNFNLRFSLKRQISDNIKIKDRNRELERQIDNITKEWS